MKLLRYTAALILILAGCIDTWLSVSAMAVCGVFLLEEAARAGLLEGGEKE